MAVKKKSTVKKPVKKVAKKSAAKKPAKKAATKKAVAKKSATKKSVAKKSVAKKSVAKKSATKKKVVKKVAKKSAAKKPAKKVAAASKIVVPPVPLTGANRSERVAPVATPPAKPTPPVAAPTKSVGAPKQATSNRVLFAAILGIVILALVVISRSDSGDDGAAPEVPVATQSAQPSAEPTAEETVAPTTVSSVEAPGKFIGNWKDAQRTIMSLTWRAPSAVDGLTGYKVELRSNMGEWTTVSELPATALSFEVTKTSADGETSFRVSSVYSDGQLAESQAFGFAGQFE